MRLRVATNWDPTLLDGIKEYPVTCLFGILPSDPVGGGRPTLALPPAAKQQVEDYVKKVRARGLSFAYLMNAPCLGNMEFDKQWHQEFLDHLAWLDSIGVDWIIASVPYLIEVVKKRYPHLKVGTSIFDRINSLERALHFERLGCDDIVLDPNINREFKLIEKIRKHVKCDLTVLVNVYCLYQCPFSFYHSEQIGHASQSWHPAKGYYVEYCWYSCMKRRLEDPAELIKAPWVRPEDVALYEEVGINNFKIGDRAARTAWLLNVVRAYASRRHEGNLLDLFNISTGTIQFVLHPYAGEGFTPALPYVDNRLLDGFIRHFRERSCCLASCEECGYCERIARKAVTSSSDVQRTAECFGKALEDVVNGNAIVRPLFSK